MRDAETSGVTEGSQSGRRELSNFKVRSKEVMGTQSYVRALGEGADASGEELLHVMKLDVQVGRLESQTRKL